MDDTIRMRRWWRSAAMIVALATIIGLLLFGYRYLDDLAHGRTGTLVPRLIEELTNPYTVALLVPGLVWVARRWPFGRGRRLETLAVHALAIILFSLSHTTLYIAIRALLGALAGLGAHWHAVTPMRYLVELPTDALWYAVIVGLVTLFDRRGAARDHELREARLQSRLAQAQLQSLQVQLQPHFLFNTLNTIASVMHEDTRAADAMLVKLSALLRRALRASPAQEATLGEELRALALYLDIMRERFHKRLDVRIDAPPVVKRALVPPLILQPIVENAIQHGLDPTSTHAGVEVRCAPEDGLLVLEVRDHGAGLCEPPEAILRKGGSLSIVADRLARLYGQSHRLELRNVDSGGLRVTVRIPYRLAGEDEGAES